MKKFVNIKKFRILFIVIIISLVLNEINAVPQSNNNVEDEGDFDPLHLHTKDTSERNMQIDDGKNSQRQPSSSSKNSLIRFNYNYVSAPLTIASWFLTVAIMQIIFHRFRYVHYLFPDSALFIVLGLLFGFMLYLIYPHEAEMYLKPDWFFLYLLPPIALDAGYFLPNGDFFRNIGAILSYAVIGTLYNTLSIGLTLIVSSKLFAINSKPMELLLFSTLISAVDPVAVLCVFEEIHVNEMLYVCVFGESLLNDAVSIVLYNTFNNMLEQKTIVASDYVKASASFFIVSLGGIVIGILGAVLTGFTTKYSGHINVVQPLICLLVPYLAYLVSEMISMSGILAIMVCGVMMKHFLGGNLSRKSLVTVQYFLKTLSSSCEAVIFVGLGVSAVSKNHEFNIIFIAITILSCLIHRFIGIFGLSWLINRKRTHKIHFVDQFIMSYGGLRGAVCYGLVMSLDPTILKNSMAGIEAIIGHYGHNTSRNIFIKWSDKYIKPLVMSNHKTQADAIIDFNEHLQVKEAIKHIKEHGSIARFPTANSMTNLVIPEIRFPSLNDKLDGKISTRRISLPYSQSVTSFVRQKLDYQRTHGDRGIYSRHLLGIDNSHHKWKPKKDLAIDFDALNSGAYHMTYPYAEKTDKSKMSRKRLSENPQQISLKLFDESHAGSFFIGEPVCKESSVPLKLQKTLRKKTEKDLEGALSKDN